MTPPLQTPGRETQNRIGEAYSKLPLSFEANRGQTDKRVNFLARGQGYSLFLTPTEAVLALKKPIGTSADGAASVTFEESDAKGVRLKGLMSPPSRQVSETSLRLKLSGANSAPQVAGVEELPGTTNYFIGNDARKWTKNVESYAKVKYKDVYPGIDVVYYGNQRQLEYDFVVAPGSDPSNIRLDFVGADQIRVDAAGQLVLRLGDEEVRQHKPFIYQEVDGMRREIAGRYTLDDARQVGFEVAPYDASRPLVIDPILVYSTYLGGLSGDNANAIAVDASGNAYVTGATTSLTFPTVNPVQGVSGSGADIFVLKLNPTGTAFIFSTYLGGSINESANGIALDPGGNIYLTGNTNSFNFPTANAPFQAAKAGGTSAFFRSTDNAQTWNPASADLTAPTVMIIAPHPTDPSIVLAGAITGGAAVYKSIDGGVNWVPSNVGLQGVRQTEGLVYDPVNPSNVYVGIGGNAARVFKSVDGGISWSETSTGLPPTGRLENLAIDPNNPSTLYVGLVGSGNTQNDSGGVYKSTNGGQSWSAVNNGLQCSFCLGRVQSVYALAVDTRTSTVYLNASEGVFKSTDGVNWAATGLNNPGTESVGDANSLAINVNTNPSTIYVSRGNDGVYKSTNGQNFTPINNGLAPAATRLMCGITFDHRTTPTTLYAGDLGNGVYKSTDDGLNWSPANLNNGRAFSVILDTKTTPGRLYAGLSTGLDAFVTRLNSTGSLITYSTYLGGSAQGQALSSDDTGLAVAADANGNFYVTGQTSTGSFPILNALQSTPSDFSTAFLTKFNSFGASVYSTYLGGTVDSFAGTFVQNAGRGVTVDAGGNVYVTGDTTAANFPTANPRQATLNGFRDAFVTVYNPTGTAYLFSTYLGGGGSDVGRAVAVDTSSNILVAGDTNSSNFPVTNALQSASGGGQDAFVTKYSASGASYLFSTYLGGSSTDIVRGIAVDTSGNIYAAGDTLSANFPLANPLQTASSGGQDVFVSKLNSTGSAFIFSTYLGGNNNDVGTGIAANASGRAYVSGITSSINFPTANPRQALSGGATDAFVTAIDTAPNVTLAILSGRITNPAGTGVPEVNVSLSGAGSQTIKTDASGFYAFTVVTGRSYTVLPTSPYFDFTPSRVDIPNVTASMTFNFAVVPAATPTPTPPLQDDFNGAQRDPTRWNLGTLTQPAAAFDPQVSVVQQGGQLVITPRDGAPGASFNGYVSVKAFDLTNGQASVEVPRVAQGASAQTSFAVGSDTLNNYRFVVMTVASAPQSVRALLAARFGGWEKLDAEMLVLVFQVRINGVVTQQAIPYDPVQFRYWRFRHDPPQRSILFETSPDNAAYVERFRKVLEKEVTALAVELSAGTTAPTTGTSNAIFDNLSLISGSAQFAAGEFSVSEGVGSAQITVTRAGNVAGSPATLTYQTTDTDTFTVGCFDAAGSKGSAYARCDFATTIGALSFGVGEISKTLTVPIIDDGFAEGAETFDLKLVNATGASLGAPSLIRVTIQDNDAAGAANPVVTSFPFFVRQQYLDFLSREPDQDGLNAWLRVLNGCANPNAPPNVPSGCDRIFVSGEGFFRSVEFQLKGFYVFRFYKVAFSRLPEYTEIVADMSFVAGQTAEEVYARKAQLATLITQRQEFADLYGALTNAQYVNLLLSRYGLTQITTPDPAHPDDAAKVTLTAAELINRLNTNALSRAQVLRAIADSDAVSAKEFNNAFVGMQYYGYLRRKPDQSGFDAWLRVLQAGNVRTMVDGFLNSV
ncbi:MAG TPA: SBBP repeat-containing protein, partial [Pyrinomonadaceae bacterium]